MRSGEIDLDKINPDNSQRAEKAREISEQLRDVTKEIFALERMLAGNMTQAETPQVARKAEAMQRYMLTIADYLGGNVTTETYQRRTSENQRH